MKKKIEHLILFIHFVMILLTEKKNYFMCVLLINSMKNINITKKMKGIILNFMYQRLFVLFPNIIILHFLNIFVKICIF